MFLFFCGYYLDDSEGEYLNKSNRPSIELLIMCPISTSINYIGVSSPEWVPHIHILLV
jgi:hypothetical protein